MTMSRFPDLEGFLGSYFHQDWALDIHSIEGAVSDLRFLGGDAGVTIVLDQLRALLQQNGDDASLRRFLDEAGVEIDVAAVEGSANAWFEKVAQALDASAGEGGAPRGRLDPEPSQAGAAPFVQPGTASGQGPHGQEKVREDPAEVMLARPSPRRTFLRGLVNVTGQRNALLGLPFLLIACVAGVVTSSGTLHSALPTLLATSVAVAIFAVNFAFLAFQLSPYRGAVPRVPRGLAAGSAVVLLIALLPVLGLAFGVGTAATLGAVVIPLLAAGALGLLLFGQQEASPAALLARATSERVLAEYIPRFEAAARELAHTRQRLDEELRAGPVRISPPMHEVMHDAPTPAVTEDPVEMIVGLARIAVNRDDTVAFELATRQLLHLAEHFDNLNFEDSDGVGAYAVRSALARHADDGLFRITAGLADRPETQDLAERFVTLCAVDVRYSVRRSRATRDLTIDVGRTGAGLSGQLISAGRRGHSFIELLGALRQVVEIALRDMPNFQEEHRLASYALNVEFLGEKAISTRDSDALYRCSETLSWIGCSAVRYGGSETGVRAANALVQLGRQARKEGLDCFWDRCSLTPYDHAVEHLEAMVTWIPYAGERGKQWLGVLGRAMSRLRGTEVVLELEDGEDSPGVKILLTDRPHVESVSHGRVLRRYDYSDPDTVADQRLY